MIYLNFILTILCLILLSFLVCIIYFWKKYGKNLLKMTQKTPFSGGYPLMGDPNQLGEAMKMMNNLFKNTNGR